MRTFKIIVSAYACEPNVGSEPEVGWQWILQLARYNKVWVLTRKNNEGAIASSSLGNLSHNLNFIYCDLPRWASWWKKGQKGVHLYYVLWQICALIKAFKLNRSEHFDFCHHITFSPFYQPPVLSLLPIPFVWGPLGGGERLPRAFLKLFRRKHIVRELVRSFVQKLAIANPFVFFAMFKASLLIASTHETYMRIPKIFRKKAVIEMQVGMNSFVKHKTISPGGKFRLITAGRQTYWKGHILVLRAFAHFVENCSVDAELIVLGRGEEHARLKEEASSLGIGNQVTFIPFLPERLDVLSAFGSADVFVYASLLECAGYVVLEALSQGTPVVCMDLPGPGEIVDETCGIIISFEGPEDAILNISESLKKLYFDKDLLYSQSCNAINKVVDEFNWDVKGDRLQEYLIKHLGNY